MPLKPKEFISGEVFQYLGKNYSLKLPLGVSGGGKIRFGYLEIGFKETTSEGALGGSVRASIKGWYKEHILKGTWLNFVTLLVTSAIITL